MNVTRLDGALLRIPISQIEPGPNARGAVGDISELAVSISAIGQQIPALVEQIGEGRYRLIDGHRRYSAIRLAGGQYMDAVLRRSPGDATRIIRQLAMHAQARPFEPIAEAQALHRLMWEYRMDREQIARMIGKGPAWVRDRLALLNLTEEEQAAVQQRQMPLREAVEVVRQRRAARDGQPVTPRPRRRHCPTCTCGEVAA